MLKFWLQRQWVSFEHKLSFFVLHFNVKHLRCIFWIIALILQITSMRKVLFKFHPVIVKCTNRHFRTNSKFFSSKNIESIFIWLLSLIERLLDVSSKFAPIMRHAYTSQKNIKYISIIQFFLV